MLKIGVKKFLRCTESARFQQQLRTLVLLFSRSDMLNIITRTRGVCNRHISTMLVLKCWENCLRKICCRDGYCHVSWLKLRYKLSGSHRDFDYFPIRCLLHCLFIHIHIYIHTCTACTQPQKCNRNPHVSCHGPGVRDAMMFHKCKFLKYMYHMPNKDCRNSATNRNLR